MKRLFGLIKTNIMQLVQVWLAVFLLCSGSAFASNSPAIAVAANVKFAVDDIAQQFKQDTGLSVRLSYGSSGNFVSQIQHGAPFELLISADEFYPQQLHQAKLTPDEGLVYALGRVAIAAPKRSSLKLDSQLQGLADLANTGALTRFAIANPAHAPYGEVAKQILQQKQLWQAIETKVIMGENASQATQFAVSGSTQGGIVPLSLALAPNFSRMGQYVEVDPDLYQPIKQRMILTNKATDTSIQFYQYMQSEFAKAVLKKYGFSVPATPHTASASDLSIRAQ
ncbi:molybdate ABC transporter substrate-binding protein [Shewanella gaetbuli]|uniref:Molybdate ABC transporter substrate-binding protein n=1 Tax=Shewanella gaetbuli TaxID=220752 RepID=A0A9X1ZKZ2_9GAMM|nr:molybdate ABC transporter substrate-binding protein [Shewanella gaetbuli]MCL1144234.1 molybdate ABC transporter substrate-binding protein [Shewanella gaetbuli]